MKGQTRAEGLMVKYHTYALNSLKPRVTDPADVRILDSAVSGMEKVLDLVYQRLEDMIIGDKPLWMDFQEKIDDLVSTQKDCYSKAIKYILFYPHVAIKYWKTARKCDIPIHQLEVLRDNERARQNAKPNTLAQRLALADFQTEGRHFESYLREMHIDLTPEDRARYVESPDHMFFDAILALREKYDPTGKI